MELSGPKIKKFLLFSQKSFSYISRNRTFQKGTFQAQKYEKTPPRKVS